MRVEGCGFRVQGTGGSARDSRAVRPTTSLPISAAERRRDNFKHSRTVCNLPVRGDPFIEVNDPLFEVKHLSTRCNLLVRGSSLDFERLDRLGVRFRGVRAVLRRLCHVYDIYVRQSKPAHVRQSGPSGTCKTVKPRCWP